MKRIVVTAWALLLICGPVLTGLSGCAMLKHATESPRHVLVISIDGLRPELYQSNDYEAATLKRLVASGISADGMLPVFPTLTSPNHTTMITGVTSARHGILANFIFSPEKGPTAERYQDSRLIKVPTLWDKARAAGRSVAIVRWPVSVGAPVDWLVPEVFVPGFHFDQDWNFLKEKVNKDLWTRILPTPDYGGFKSISELDEFDTQAAVKIIQDHHPHLTFVHLFGLDLIQHETGRASVETKAELRVIDALVKRLTDAADLATTTMLIVGDHGFLDYDKTLNINAFFARRGWLKGSRAVAQVEGGQAAIYTKDKTLDRKVLKLLKKNARNRWRVIDRDQLDELGAYPDALCALEAQAGYAFGEGDSGNVEVASKEKRGTHGQLPSHPELHSGFIAAGAGIDGPSRMKLMRMVSLAPMIARILGIEAPNPR